MAPPPPPLVLPPAPQQPLPWSAPPPLPPSLVASTPRAVASGDGRKVIRLRQKRQRIRMLGAYRRLPTVEHMCKVLEDADFDKTDLFPLGAYFSIA